MEQKDKDGQKRWTETRPGYMSNDDIEEAKRAARAKQRNLVLAQIEWLEDTDPNYHRPEWISKDEISSFRRDGYTALTERERDMVSNRQLFEQDVERFFPHPRDHE